MKKQIKPYSEEGPGKKQQIRSMFDNIAPYYDFLNHFLSLGVDIRWRKKAIKELVDIAPKNVLDVATGTADVTLELYKQLAPEKIMGIDISPEMLEIGRKKIKKKGLEHTITLQEADSENLPFEDNTFDAVTVSFGVRNFEHLDIGLKEMFRVLKKDGKLVVLEFSQPSLFPFKQLYNFYFRYILPLIGRITSKDQKAYTYLYESVQAFPDSKAFLNILQNTGFKSTECTPLSLGICTIYSGTK